MGQEFKEAMESMGLTAEEGRAYGSQNGWPFWVDAVAGGSACVRFFFGENVSADVRRALKEKCKEIKGLGMQVSGTVLTLTVDTAKQPLAQGVEAALQIAAETLSGPGVPKPPETCLLCKQGGCDVYAMVGDKYAPAHRACVEAACAAAQAEAQHNEAKGSYLTGALGALLGALVGAVPNVFSMWFGDRIYLLLYMLVPICSYYGYKLFRGRLNKAAPVIVAVFSLVQVYIVEMLLAYLILLDEGMRLSLPMVVQLYHRYMTLGDMMSSMGMPLLFTLGGIFLSWGIISRNNQTARLDAERSMESMQPIQEAAQRL